MKELWDLFSVFCRIGAFTFGGGYAMLPIIQEEIVNKRNWATDEEVIDYYAIGQCTPGIIAVNTATFIGYKKKGVLGAIFATLGMIFPSILIITLIAGFFTHFQDNPIINHAFAGIRVAVVVLVLNAVIRMWKTSVKDWLGIVVFIATFVLISFMNISPIPIILSSAALGILISYRKGALK